MSRQDHIKINGLSLNTHLKNSPWTVPGRPSPLQPVKISVDITHDVSAAAATDDLDKSINYSAIARIVQRICAHDASSIDREEYPLIEVLAERITAACLLDDFPTVQKVAVEVDMMKGVFCADGAGVCISRRRDGRHETMDRFFVRNLKVNTIIGVREHEKKAKQPVVLNLKIERPAHFPLGERQDFLAAVAGGVVEHLENSAYLTVEKLSTEVARLVLGRLPHDNVHVTVGVAKPFALPITDSAEVVVTRTLSDFQALSSPTAHRVNAASANGVHLAALAIGSNLGDRFRNIEFALRMLEKPARENPVGWVTVIDTSFMYETAPMYVTDQPNFINCACLVETPLSARELLRLLKEVEDAVGRVPSVRFGPRAVDLDIITFDRQIVDTRQEGKRDQLDNMIGELIVPHPRMPEREFVLRPLNDIIPEWIHPRLNKPIHILLNEVVASKQPNEAPMHKVIPFPFSDRGQADSTLGVPPTATYWVLPPHPTTSPSHISKTFLMATLNTTPDSFSDGALHNTIPTAVAYTVSAVAAGADIIDIGGYSTRPGAAFVSPEDETARVVPVIQAIRAHTDASVCSVLISIDTFRPDVARAAVLAGANCINDVYAFRGQGYPAPRGADEHFEQMRNVTREFGVPVVMMHSRGDAGANKDYAAFAPSAGLVDASLPPVIDGIRVELGSLVHRATYGKGGVRRWLVVVDPGVGFSKTLDDNLNILRHASRIAADERIHASVAELGPAATMYTTPRRNPLFGFPQLIGTSRKSFLGTLLAQPPTLGNPSETLQGRETQAKERGFATAAAVACAVQQGAAIVRVHDVQEMADVITIASALWRS